MDKTLGQIAFEAAEQTGLRWNVSWAESFGKSDWEEIASAVAAAVKEEDARICYDRHANGNWKHDTRDDCASAIRASIKGVK